MQDILPNQKEQEAEKVIKTPHQLEPNLATVFGKLRLMAIAIDTHGASDTGLQKNINTCYTTLITALDNGQYIEAKKCLKDLRDLSSTVQNPNFAKTINEVTHLTNNIPQLRLRADEIGK